MHVHAINLKERVAVTDTLVMCQITKVYDVDGDEIDAGGDLEFAYSCVVALPGGLWACCLTNDYITEDFDLQRLQQLQVN